MALGRTPEVLSRVPLSVSRLLWELGCEAALTERAIAENIVW